MGDAVRKDVKVRALELSIDVIRYLGGLERKIKYKVISDQLIRSVTSIGANLTEAKASSSKKEYINYFQIALKSANESLYWLTMLKELTKDRVIEKFIGENEEIGKIIGAGIVTLKAKIK